MNVVVATTVIILTQRPHLQCTVSYTHAQIRRHSLTLRWTEQQHTLSDTLLASYKQYNARFIQSYSLVHTNLSRV